MNLVRLKNVLTRFILQFNFFKMLAVVYETFTGIEKDKFRKLLLHKRQACKLAFRLLVSKQSPDTIRFKQFQGLMRYYLPHTSK